MKLSNYTLPQWFCVAGILLIFGATVRMGWVYWMERGDIDAALITVGCEAVALGGFMACWANSHGREWWKAALLRALGVCLVLLAAGWIVFTTYGKLADDAHTRAVASVERTPIYIAAKADWEQARRIAQNMSDWEAANPPVADAAACRCPDTIEARQRNFEAEANRRREVENQELAQMQALIPAPAFSAVLIFRSIAAESVKLLGFVAFGIGGALHEMRTDKPQRPASPKPRSDAPPQQPRQPRERARRAQRVSGGGGVDAEVWQMLDD